MKIWQYKTLYVKLVSTFDSDEYENTKLYLISIGGADTYINLVCFISPQNHIVIETILQFPKALSLAQLSVLIMVLGNNEKNIIEELIKSHEEVTT